ncbi:MAG: hypothetical protein WKF97_14945 [Chitinophagaceae bacterium]
MIDTNDFNIDEETIGKAGLRPSDKHINAGVAIEARVFDYPHLENVFLSWKATFMATRCLRVHASLFSRETMWRLRPQKGASYFGA